MDCNGSLIIGEEKRNYRGADPTFSFSQPASVAAGVLVQPLPMKKFCFPNPTSVASDAGSSLPGPSSDAGSIHPGPASDESSSSSIMASVAGSMRSKERASSVVSDLDANPRNLTNSGANEEETNVENAEINATNPVTNEERGAENTQMF